MLNASQRRVNKNSLTWWYVLKTSWRYLCKTSWRRLQNILKTSWRFLEDVFRRRLENVLKTYGQDEYIGLGQDVLKTFSEDVQLRRIYSPWSRRLLKTKTKDVFKASSSRRMFAGLAPANYRLLRLTWYRLQDDAVYSHWFSWWYES